MEPRYRDAINDASAKLSQALLEDIPTLLEQGLRLDALVRDVLRSVAVALLSPLYQGLCAYLVEQATARGLTVQSRLSCASKRCLARWRWNPPTCAAPKVVNRRGP